MPVSEKPVKLMGDELIAFDEITFEAFILTKFYDAAELDFSPGLIEYLQDNTDKFIFPCGVHDATNTKICLENYDCPRDYLDSLAKYELPKLDCKNLHDKISPIFKKALNNTVSEYTFGWISFYRSGLEGNWDVDDASDTDFMEHIHLFSYLNSLDHKHVDKISQIIKFANGRPTIFITADSTYKILLNELKDITKGTLTIAKPNDIEFGTDDLINKYNNPEPITDSPPKPSIDDLRSNISELLRVISNSDRTAIENEYIKELNSKTNKPMLTKPISK